MKTNSLQRTLIIAFAAIVIFGVILYTQKAGKRSIPVQKNSISNQFALTDFNSTSNAKANVTKSNGFFAVSNVQQEVAVVANGPDTTTTQSKLESVTSPSGKRAEISPDGRRVILTDKSGNLIWSKDIVETFGTNLPMYFTGKISKPAISGNILVLRGGNEYIEVDIQTGEVIARKAR